MRVVGSTIIYNFFTGGGRSGIACHKGGARALKPVHYLWRYLSATLTCRHMELKVLVELRDCHY